MHKWQFWFYLTTILTFLLAGTSASANSNDPIRNMGPFQTATCPTALDSTTLITRASIPPSFAAQAVGETSIQVSWTVPSDIGAGAYYELFYGRFQGGPYEALVKIQDTAATTYTIENLAPNATYHLLFFLFDPSKSIPDSESIGELVVTTGSGQSDLMLHIGEGDLTDISSSVDCFTLVDGQTLTDIQPLNTNDALDLATITAQPLYIRAYTFGGVSGVRFDFNGQSYTDSSEPFILDGVNVGVASDNLQFLTVTPYVGGVAGAPRSIEYTVTNSNPQPTPSVASLILVNADTGEDLETLTSESILNLATLPPNLSVRAVTSPETVGSVEFIYNDNPESHVENTAPYSFLGDENGVYTPVNFQVGSVSLTAIPYSEPDEGGIEGAAFEVIVAVVNEPLVDQTPPTLTITGELTVQQGGRVIIPASIFQVVDPLQTPPQLLTFNLVQAPTLGSLELYNAPFAGNQIAWIDIQSGTFAYVHNNEAALGDAIGFTITNGGGITSNPATLAIGASLSTGLPTGTDAPTGPTLLDPSVVGLNIIPNKNRLLIGETVTVAIQGQNLSNLYGLSLDCRVDAAILGGSTFSLGSLFDPTNNLTLDQGFQPDGSWVVVGLQRNPAPAINGTGDLFILTFNALALGTSQISCAPTASNPNGSPLSLEVPVPPSLEVVTALVEVAEAPDPVDTDGDGFMDNNDECPTAGNQGNGVDDIGCPIPPDTDGDGVSDTSDLCLNEGDQGAGVDAFGCPITDQTVDTDGDTFPDNNDECPTEGDQGLGVDDIGCPIIDNDQDDDGFLDDNDECPTQGDLGGGVDAIGCPIVGSEADGDQDGVPDGLDQCPDQGNAGTGVDANGCPASVVANNVEVNQFVTDTDGDGFSDENDECPTEGNLGNGLDDIGCPIPLETPNDADGDGFTNDLDACPNLAGTAQFDGCPEVDTDGDGLIDSFDECPTEGDQGLGVNEIGCPIVEQVDTDGDGVDDTSDLCPDTPAGAVVDEEGCPVEQGETNQEAPENDPPVEIPSISGQVIAVDLTVVTVNIVGVDIDQTQPVDAEGFFSFAELPFGSYTITVTAPHHLPASLTFDYTAELPVVLLPPVTLANGDLNDDGNIDVNDVPLVFSLFGQSTNVGDADLNRDGTVNVLDMAILANNLGKTGVQPWL